MVFVFVLFLQFSSVAQSCPTLCNPMNRSTPGLPVHHHLPEFTQTHVHWVSDAIQPAHPLLSPSPPAPNPSQHQSLFPISQLFTWGGQSTRVSALASFLPKKSQGWSPLEWTGWISLLSKGLSRVFSNTTVQKHQFFGAQHGKIHPCLASSQIPFVSFFDFIIFKMKTFDTFFFPPQNVRPHSNQKIDFLKAFAESHTPTIIKRCTRRTVWGCGEEKLSK